MWDLSPALLPLKAYKLEKIKKRLLFIRTAGLKKKKGVLHITEPESRETRPSSSPAFFSVHFRVLGRRACVRAFMRACIYTFCQMHSPPWSLCILLNTCSDTCLTLASSSVLPTAHFLPKVELGSASLPLLALLILLISAVCVLSRAHF